MPEARPSGRRRRASGKILLVGLGREGSSLVHGLDEVPEAVRKLFITASPIRAVAGSPDLLTVRNGSDWHDGLRAALAGAPMLIALAAVAGREEQFTREVLSLGRRAGALAVGVLVEPILSHSPHKSGAVTELTRGVIRSADATMLFPARPLSGAALTLSEALENWTRQLFASVRGLLSAAAADSAMDMDLSDVASVLSGHSRATVGAGVGKTVEDALRDAVKRALAPPSEVATARSVFAHVIGDRGMPLDDARRVLPVLEHLFPKAEVGCGVSVGEQQGEIRATVIAGKLQGELLSTRERRRTLEAESPFFKVGDPTVYDGENLDIPTFVRKDVPLPGHLPQPAPSQMSLFDGPGARP